MVGRVFAHPPRHQARYPARIEIGDLEQEQARFQDDAVALATQLLAIESRAQAVLVRSGLYLRGSPPLAESN